MAIEPRPPRRLAGDDAGTLDVPPCPHLPIARTFDPPVLRDMLRALGIETCDTCHQAIRIHGRRRSLVRET